MLVGMGPPPRRGERYVGRTVVSTVDDRMKYEVDQADYLTTFDRPLQGVGQKSGSAGAEAVLRPSAIRSGRNMLQLPAYLSVYVDDLEGNRRELKRRPIA